MDLDRPAILAVFGLGTPHLTPPKNCGKGSFRSSPRRITVFPRSHKFLSGIFGAYRNAYDGTQFQVVDILDMIHLRKRSSHSAGGHQKFLANTAYFLSMAHPKYTCNILIPFCTSATSIVCQL
ncbi:hypothetical protein M378DRAFT_174526, partial [Amanita muscaria Koide BX008]